jgi:hypothetical protein
MDAEAFIRWALDDARTVDDRYTVELLVELGLGSWNSKRKIYDWKSLDDSIALSRERKLNPAYEPHYSEDDLRKAVEYLAEIKDWSVHVHDRPIRSFEPLRFLTTLESINCAFGEPVSVAPLAELPMLRSLALGYPGAERYNGACADFTPLARCKALRKLTLGFGVHWPDFSGIEKLTQLETFHLSGNLHALPRGVTFPNVRQGSLYCLPLAARNVADLPQFPACELLTLSDAERLDGIEKFSRLRNLTILGPFHSFDPLQTLDQLTCLTVIPESHRDPEMQPRDVSPLARLPKLHFFKIGPPHSFIDMPRDYSPLAEAPALRELIVQNCPPVEMEVAAIQAGLPPWDDTFLLPEPRPLPPLRMIMAPFDECPRRAEPHYLPGETGLVDAGLRECEERWVANYMAEAISERIGHRDWGEIRASGVDRTFSLTIESFEVVERLPEIFDAARSAISRLRADYMGWFGVHLKVRPPELSPAQKELEDELWRRRNQWEHEQHSREQAEYLERLHQMELKKQQGFEIDPVEFSPAEQPPYPQMEDILPAEEKAAAVDFTTNDDDGNSDIAVETDPDPPPSFLDDDEHPLAENYMCAGRLTLDEVWFYNHFRGIAVHLMQREPDLEIPKEEKPE